MNQVDVSSILTIGVISGAAAWILSMVLGVLQKRAIDRLPHPNKRLAAEVEQVRVVEFEGNPDDIFRTTIDAIRTINRSTISNADRKAMLVEAKTGLNWKTFGDKIRVALQEKGPDHVSLEITSKPKIWGTRFDYGKNFDNVEQILAYLRLRYRQI